MVKIWVTNHTKNQVANNQQKESVSWHTSVPWNGAHYITNYNINTYCNNLYTDSTLLCHKDCVIHKNKPEKLTCISFSMFLTDIFIITYDNK